MSEPTIPDDDRQRRLEEAMAEYLISADAGRPLEPEAFLAHYPDLRAELVEFLADLSSLAVLVKPLLPAGAIRPSLGSAFEPESPLPLCDVSTVSGAATTGLGATISRDPSIGPGSTTDPATTAVLSGGVTGTDAPVSLPGGTRVRYFGDYELIKELGRGGMAVVYKARQISLNRLVALKMIKSGALASDDDLRRFQNEAEAVAMLDHPHIVPILEVGNHDGHHYFSMKLIGGTSLDKKLVDYVANPATAAELLRKASEAVHHAHQRGILHRDLKPANILLDERGEPFVSDFGLAKRVVGDSELTHSGAILGTPAYMAPEQASSQRGAVTTASDVYGLGAVLYALLTGRAPFGGESAAEILDGVRDRVPEPVSKHNHLVPRDLEIICMKCLGKEPRSRYGSAESLADDLDRWLRGMPITARPAPAWEKAIKWARRRPEIAALLMALTLVAVAGLFGVIWQWRMAVASAESARRIAYVAHINLADKELHDSHVDRAAEILDGERPRPSVTDLRGFEWFYLDQLCHSYLAKVDADVGWATCVAFSPDGQHVAWVDQHSVVRIWDAGLKREVRSIRPDADSVNALAFNPGGSCLAAAGMGSHKGHLAWVGLIDVATGRVQRSSRVPGGWNRDVAFGPGAGLYATVDQKGVVRIWDVGSGENMRTLQGGGDSRARIAFSPDGKRVASAGKDKGTVSIWDVSSGRLESTLTGHEGRVTAVAFGPRGGVLASAGGTYEGAPNEVVIWDLSTGKASLSIRAHTGDINDLKFSPDGRELISAGGEGQIKRWDARNGKELETIQAHQTSVNRVAFSPDGVRFASAGGRMNVSGEVKLWDREGYRGSRHLTGKVAAFGRYGTRIAIARTGAVEVRDLRSLAIVTVLGGHDDTDWSKHFTDIAFAPTGDWIAAVDRVGTITIWDATTGQLIPSLQGAPPLGRPVSDISTDLDVSPDGKRLALSRLGKIALWEAPRLRKVWERTAMGGDVIRLAFSTDGRRIVKTTEPGILTVIDADTGRDTLAIRHRSKGGILGVAFSSNRRLIATGGYDGTLTLYDADNGKELRAFRGHTGAVYDLTFSPDSRRLASAGEAIKLWDLETVQQLISLEGVAHRVEFSPDGNHLVSSSYDGVKVRSIR
jgi:WD40 repeat protein/tRNA A-37 threonylcarbamoyl transferase component Bud32